jgi:hypothetical protein
VIISIFFEHKIDLFILELNLSLLIQMNTADNKKEYLEDFELDPQVLKQQLPNKRKVIKKLLEKKEENEDVVGPNLRKIPKCNLEFFLCSF